VTSPERLAELLNLAPRAWRLALDRRLRPHGLSQAKWLTLLHLARCGGELPHGELAARLGIEPATLVRLVDRLERDGWVTRAPNPADRRGKRVVLTPRARALGAHLERTANALRAELLADVPREDLAAAIRVLGHIATRARSR
jgi:MarR family transcriptional regulator for hemolysin